MKRKIKLGHLLSKKMEVKNNSNCLSENTLSEFIEKKLPPEEKDKVFEHLNSCGDCYDVYKITSSNIADLKKVKKRNLFKSLSIAASIIFVFLIGFYYNNFYKPKSEDMQIYQKKEFDMKKPSIKKEVETDDSFSFKSKDKDNSKRKILSKETLSIEGKKSEQITRSKSPRAVDSKNIGKTKRKPNKGIITNIPKEGRKEKKQIIKKRDRINSDKSRIITESIGKMMEDEETSIRRPKAPLKKSQKIKATKIFLNEESREVSNKKKSDFLILLEQGYVYKKKNNFGKLTKEQVLMLLADWKKLIPNLRGTQQDIALETISYLQKKKLEMPKDK